MLFFLIFSINKNVIKVHNNKNIELLYQVFIDVILKYSWYVYQAKRYYLVLNIGKLFLVNQGTLGGSDPPIL